MNLTDTFIDILDSLRRATLSPTVSHQAKRCLLDYLGATLAGAEMLDARIRVLLEDVNESVGECAVIGVGRCSGSAMAAFANGLSSHAAELDDGVISGIVHPGAPLFSALLPVAQQNAVGGRDLLRGIVTGYEAAVRLADAIQPSHKARGYHATSTCGAAAAAIGIAAMLALPKARMKDAFSAAAVSAAGSLKVLEDDSELKPFNVGRAAAVGLLSATMARAGFIGPCDVLEGTGGFLTTLAADVHVEHLTKAAGAAFGVERVYVKPYAACRYCHGGIEAALDIRRRSGLDPEQIASVDVSTYRWAVAKHDHTEISNASSAKMSIPYSVAVALARGRAGIHEFSAEVIGDALVTSLTRKVKVRSDEELTALFPAKTVTVVDVVARDGGRYSKRIDAPKGEPETPLSDAELENKFAELASYAGQSRDAQRNIVNAVWNLEDDLPALFRLL